MGVKQKTPTPFVGAGSVKTITPNLGGLGSAIAGSADDLLTTRFEDRKQVALDNAEIDSHALIKYDENGKLMPITNLPQDDSWYSQSLRLNARVNYFSALSQDLKLFSDKTLSEHPNDPVAVREKMDIYRESANIDLEPSLEFNTNLSIKEITEQNVLKAQGNLITEQRKNAVLISSERINQLEIETYSSAEHYNGGIFNGKLNSRIEQDYRDSLMLGALSGNSEYSTDPTWINAQVEKFKQNTQVYKSLYSSKQFLNVLEDPTSSEDQKDAALIALSQLQTKITEKYKGNNEQLKFFNTQWNRKVTEAKNKYEVTEKIINKRIKKDQANNNFNTNLNLITGNHGLESWLSDPVEMSKRISNKSYSISDLITLSNKYHEKINTEEKVKLDLQASFLLNAYENNNATLADIENNEHIMNNKTLVKEFMAIRDKKVKENNELIVKQATQNQNINILNVQQHLETIMEDENSVLHIYASPPTAEALEEELIQRGFIDKEIWYNGTYNRKGALNEILTKRTAIMAHYNKIKKINDAKELSIKNKQPMPTKDHNKMLEEFEITFDINENDPLEFFIENNEKYRTLNGPLNSFLNEPQFLTTENADKMLPLIEKIMDRKNGVVGNNLYLKIDEAAREFWKTYISGLKTVDPNEAYKQAQSAFKAMQTPEARDHADKRYGSVFRQMDQKSYNPKIGGSFIEDYDLGLVSWANFTYGALDLIPFINFDNNANWQNKGMNLPLSNYTQNVEDSDKKLDLTNEEHQNFYIQHNFNKIASQSEGVVDFIQNFFKMDSWNDKEWRALVDTWGEYGNLSEMKLPIAVAQEANKRFRILVNEKPNYYMNNGENRDLALFTLSMEILKEGNYTPEFSGPDGILRQDAGYKNYSLKWEKNSLTEAIATTGWRDAGIRFNPDLAGQEISHHFHNRNWNKDPYNPGKFLFTPQDFGEESFFDVKWAIKKAGVDDTGKPIAHLYYVDKEDGRVRPVTVKELVRVDEEDINGNKTGETIVKETGNMLPVIYPYGYKNSFYNAIYKDQSGKIEEWLDSNPKIQKLIGGNTTQLLAEAYLGKGLNLFGPSDMAGASPNLMNIIMESYESELFYNSKKRFLEDAGEGDKPPSHVFDFWDLNPDYNIDSKNQNLD